MARLRKLYHTAGAAFLTLALLYLVARPWLPEQPRIAPQGSAQVEERYGMDLLRQVYPGRSDEEIRALLHETWDRGFRYRPYLQFAESEYRGKFVNVSPEGYRIHDPAAPWPPDSASLNVFAFGDSNTMGYGLSDRETWPCLLEEKLRAGSDRPVRVYNFGCGYYYSTQEVLLLQVLLLRGIKPDVAVFLDGLSDAHPHTADDTPRFTDELRLTFEPESVAQIPASSWDGQAMWKRLGRNRRWAQSLARESGFLTLFAIQPIPNYAASGRDYPFTPWLGTRQLQIAKKAYENAPREDVLWLAELGREADFPAYLDTVHYSPRMSALLAGELAKALLPHLKRSDK